MIKACFEPWTYKGAQLMSGIDYGMGQTNIDVETGIRYGVLPYHEVLQAWCDDAESVYPEPEPEPEDLDEDGEPPDDFYDMLDPVGFKYEQGGYKCWQGHDDPDIFILQSNYYTLCGFCSPCAPGAGYLLTPGDVKAYCLGHDWFEGGKAPYRVFRVDNNEEVLPNVN